MRNRAVLPRSFANFQKFTGMSVGAKKLIPSLWTLLCVAAAAHGLPWNSDNDYLVLVEYDSATISGTNIPVSQEVHFHRILRDLGLVDRVDRASVRIVEYSRATGFPVEYRPIAAGDEKYEMPFCIYRDARTHTPALHPPNNSASGARSYFVEEK